MINDMNINAEQVRILRESRGWSQEHLAEVSGLSLRTIQRIEADGRGSRESKLSLAAAFDVPLGRLCSTNSATAGQIGGGETTAVSLTLVGTLVVIVGLVTGMNKVLLVAGSAFLLSSLALHGLQYLNTMRRAAGLTPLLATPPAESGLTVLICGAAVTVLGYSVSGQAWWVPGGVLMTFGTASMLWPLLVRQLTTSGRDAESKVEATRE